MGLAQLARAVIAIPDTFFERVGEFVVVLGSHSFRQAAGDALTFVGAKLAPVHRGANVCSLEKECALTLLAGQLDDLGFNGQVVACLRTKLPAAFLDLRRLALEGRSALSTGARDLLTTPSMVAGTGAEYVIVSLSMVGPAFDRLAALVTRFFVAFVWVLTVFGTVGILTVTDAIDAGLERAFARWANACDCSHALELVPAIGRTELASRRRGLERSLTLRTGLEHDNSYAELSSYARMAGAAGA